MTKMDELGKQGWTPFTQYYQRIWKLYNRYGDRVIEVEFEEEGKEGQDEVKNIFLEAKGERTFLEKLTELWIKKYQIIINSCADIEKVYSLLKYPTYMRAIYLEKEETSGKNNFYVSEEFFTKLMGNISQLISYVYANECVYEIQLIIDGPKRITINKKIPIASMLKDE